MKIHERFHPRFPTVKTLVLQSLLGEKLTIEPQTPIMKNAFPKTKKKTFLSKIMKKYLMTSQLPYPPDKTFPAPTPAEEQFMDPNIPRKTTL